MEKRVVATARKLSGGRGTTLENKKEQKNESSCVGLEIIEKTLRTYRVNRSNKLREKRRELDRQEE